MNDKLHTLKGLIDKYAELSNTHGQLAIFGPAKDRKYHEHMETIYDKLLICITRQLLQEVHHAR